MSFTEEKENPQSMDTLVDRWSTMNLGDKDDVQLLANFACTDTSASEENTSLPMPNTVASNFHTPSSGQFY